MHINILPLSSRTNELKTEAVTIVEYRQDLSTRLLNTIASQEIHLLNQNSITGMQLLRQTP